MFYVSHFEHATSFAQLIKPGPIIQRAVFFWTAFLNLIFRAY